MVDSCSWNIYLIKYIFCKGLQYSITLWNPTEFPLKYHRKNIKGERQLHSKIRFDGLTGVHFNFHDRGILLISVGYPTDRVGRSSPQSADVIVGYHMTCLGCVEENQASAYFRPIEWYSCIEYRIGLPHCIFGYLRLGFWYRALPEECWPELIQHEPTQYLCYYLRFGLWEDDHLLCQLPRRPLELCWARNFPYSSHIWRGWRGNSMPMERFFGICVSLPS